MLLQGPSSGPQLLACLGLCLCQGASVMSATLPYLSVAWDSAMGQQGLACLPEPMLCCLPSCA